MAGRRRARPPVGRVGRRAGPTCRRCEMATTRKQDLKAMVATLETWAGQIAESRGKGERLVWSADG